MSDKPTDPKPASRRPQFFRPEDVGEPEDQAQAKADLAEPEPQIAPARPDPEQSSPPRLAALHQPKDKRENLDPPSREDDFAPDEAMGEAQARTTTPTLADIKRGFRWTGVLVAAAGALAAMAFTAWLHSHVEDPMARQDWIGWLALGLVLLVCLALLMIAISEFFALRRLKKLGNLRELAERALKHDERKAAQKIQSQITGLFHGRRSLAWGLANLKEHEKQVLTARDRLTLVERSLMVPLDGDARKIVANSAKRVSVMTAISPFVFLDMLLVAGENFKMLRRLMSLYGGRPGLLSQFRMIKMMIANLAVSGGVAVGADLIGHVIGGQVATKLAGRVGEGMINGSLTARLGITATKLIRPLPYTEAKPTTITAFIKELTRGSKKTKK